MVCYFQYLAPSINTIGLLCDIVGAILVGSEVINQFKGSELKSTPTYYGESPPPEKSDDFKSWESRKYKHMSIGLIFLLSGFTLQIVATWIVPLIQKLVLSP